MMTSPTTSGRGFVDCAAVESPEPPAILRSLSLVTIVEVVVIDVQAWVLPPVLVPH
jgi:hypothetical protein